jgi:hypothetical protein
MISLEATTAIAETRWLVTYPNRPCDVAHTQAGADYFLHHGGTAVHVQTIIRHDNGHSEWMPNEDLALDALPSVGSEGALHRRVDGEYADHH